MKKSASPSKALSIKQPWAWAILNGKNIENRTWSTNFRGSFWIHASGNSSNSYCNEAFNYIKNYIKIPSKIDLQLGGIIGIADIVDILEPTETPIIPWHMENQFGFILKNVRPVPFVKCSGALKFWNVPENILKELEKL